MTSLAAQPKVVFVNRYFDPDQSATSQMLTDLARCLVVRGFDVRVICSRQLYDDPSAPLAARETRAGVQVYRIATTRFGRNHLPGRALDYASFYASCAAALVRLLRRGDVVVAETDPPLLSILAAPIARARHASLITWQQDVFPEIATHLGANPLPRFLDEWLKRLRDSSLRAATMNVVLGERMREHFLARGLPQAKFRVIDNWAGEDIRPKPASASALRNRLKLVDSFVICYSGNLGRAHEFDTLLGAAEVLRGESRFVFVIIGGGAKMDALQQGVAARKLQNFRFLPYQSRDTLEDSLAVADVHLVSLLPSLEGLIVPSKFYGILAAGRPLIFVGDPDGDIGRIIDRTQSGWSVGLGDSAGLTGLLRELAAQPHVGESTGQQARAAFCARFSLKHAVESWVTLLDAAPEGALHPPAPRIADTRTSSRPKTEKP